MLYIASPFGAVNERITCCKYLYYTGSVPGYCSKFNTNGLNLRTFCSTNLWKGRYGNIASYVAPEGVGSSVALAGRMKHIAKDPQGQQYVYVESPVDWIVERQDNESWTCLQLSTRLESGVYLREKFVGFPSKEDVQEQASERPVEPRSKVVVIEIFRQGSGSKREVALATEHVIEVPPDRFGKLNESSVVVAQRTSLSIVLNEGEICQVAS